MKNRYFFLRMSDLHAEKNPHFKILHLHSRFGVQMELLGAVIEIQLLEHPQKLVSSCLVGSKSKIC